MKLKEKYKRPKKQQFGSKRPSVYGLVLARGLLPHRERLIREDHGHILNRSLWSPQEERLSLVLDQKTRRPQTSLAATKRKSFWLGMARFLRPLPFNSWGTHQLRSKFHFITGVIPRAASPAMMKTSSLGEELYKRKEAPVTRFCRTNRGRGLI